MANLSFFLFAVLVIAIIGIEANPQVFGQIGDNSVIFRRETVKLPGVGGRNIATARFTFPVLGDVQNARIGAIVVSHQGRGEGSDARIVTGGPGHKSVILEIDSAPGRPIESVVALWTD